MGGDEIIVYSVKVRNTKKQLKKLNKLRKLALKNQKPITIKKILKRL